MERPIEMQKNDISLKQLFTKGIEWKNYLLRRKWFFVLAAVLGGGLGMGIATFQRASYVGELTFVLEESSKGGMLGSYAGIASQMGIDIGGMSGSSVGVFSGENIIEFLKSRMMIEKTLLSPVNGKPGTQTLADMYADVNDMKVRWEKNKQIGKISFIGYGNVRTRLKDSLLTNIFDHIVKKDLTVLKPNKKLSFMEVKVITPSEAFSKLFVERLVKEALDFYVTTKTQRSKFNVDILQAKADSIEHLLNGKTYSAAVTQDLNPNPIRNVAKVQGQMMNRDVAMLQTVYGEVIKNLELSKMNMSHETPIIQIIDAPILPLEKERLHKAPAIVIGAFVAMFLLLLYFAAMKVYTDVMSDNN